MTDRMLAISDIAEEALDEATAYHLEAQIARQRAEARAETAERERDEARAALRNAKKYVGFVWRWAADIKTSEAERLSIIQNHPYTRDPHKAFARHPDSDPVRETGEA